MGGETEAGEESGKDPSQPCAQFAYELIAEVERGVPHPTLPLEVSLFLVGGMR